MRELKILTGDSAKRTARVNHYHRYFAGYAEYKIESGNRKQRLQRVYVDPYHRHRLTDRQWRLLRLLYAMLFLVAASLFLLSASRRTGGNLAWYVALPCFLSTGALFTLLLTLAFYLSARRLMTSYAYKTGAVRLKKLSFAAFAVLGTQCLALGVYILLHLGPETARELFVLCGLGFSCAAVFAVHRIECGVVYEAVENHTEIPAESVKL